MEIEYIKWYSINILGRKFHIPESIRSLIFDFSKNTPPIPLVNELQEIEKYKNKLLNYLIQNDGPIIHRTFTKYIDQEISDTYVGQNYRRYIFIIYMVANELKQNKVDVKIIN